MMFARNLIVLIHSGHPNDIESAKISRHSFEACGYRLEEVSTSDPRVAERLQTLLRDRIHELFFFLSSNYYATAIRNGTQLLHDITGVPLVIMLHDHPLYFLNQQSSALNGTIIFAPDEMVPDFIGKYYNVDSHVVPNIGSLPHFDGAGREPDFDDFERRHNRILAPMNMIINGQTLDGTWAVIKALPEPRRSMAIRLAEAALTECTTPLHQIAERVSPDYHVADQLPVLNFIKLWRRNFMIRKLITLPILVSSEYVPADLDFRYPNKFTLLSMQETIQLYRKYRFTLNSHPLLTHTLHDRVTNALYSNSVCVTDRSAFLERYFDDRRDMLFFDYDDSSIVDTLERYIDDVDLAFDLTRRSHAIVKAHTFSLDSYQQLISVVRARWEPAQLTAHA